jgi:hypothetical protein
MKNVFAEGYQTPTAVRLEIERLISPRLPLIGTQYRALDYGSTARI